jgi:hypothetical protein
MRGFICQICKDQYPESLHHSHHKIPKSLGGADTPENMVDLCQTDHQLLHTIAYMLINNKRKHEVEPTLASIYPGEIQIQKMVLEYAGFVAREMALKKEIKKDAATETRMTLELPQLYMELLRLAAFEVPRKGGKPVGVGTLLRFMIAEFLSKKFPMKRDVIHKLRSRTPSK